MSLDDAISQSAAAQTPPNGEAASAPGVVILASRRAVRRFELERSRRLTMVMLDHLAKGVDGKLVSTAQDSVDKLNDPFLTMNRMQRELRRIIAREERLDDEDAARAERLADEGMAADEIDPAVVAARRAARRDDLFRSQQMTMTMMSRLADGLTGLLVNHAHDSVEKLNDPFLAINRMQRELRRIIALAERLEEDDAERAKRLAAEQKAEADAERRAAAWRAGRVARAAEDARKTAIRDAVTAAARDAWGDDDCKNTRHLLDDLFDDYETYEDFDGDPAELVAKMCVELGAEARGRPAGRSGGHGSGAGLGTGAELSGAGRLCARTGAGLGRACAAGRVTVRCSEFIIPTKVGDPTSSHRENTQMDPDFRRGGDGVCLDSTEPSLMSSSTQIEGGASSRSFASAKAGAAIQSHTDGVGQEALD